MSTYFDHDCTGSPLSILSPENRADLNTNAALQTESFDMVQQRSAAPTNCDTLATHQARLTESLRTHYALCHEILGLVTSENQSLRDPGMSSQFNSCQTRKGFLPRLQTSLHQLRCHARLCRQAETAERGRQPELISLVQQSQDLIMKILVLDRENEQLLLRRGLVPARAIPPVARQRPHFVADLYRRNGLGSANAD